jgi:hypothetical protein
LSFVRVAADGLVESAGYEGHFVSGRRPFEWGVGQYTYSVRTSSHELDSSGKEWTWCDATVTNTSTKENTFVASLKFPGRELELWGRNSAFVEIYGGGAPVVFEDLPELEVAFGVPRVNGAPVALEKLVASHPEHGPVSPKLMTAVLSDEDGCLDAICKLHTAEIVRTRASTVLWGVTATSLSAALPDDALTAVDTELIKVV